LICLNVQGFLKHKDEIENVYLRRFRPDILGFTETHVTEEIEDHELEINGYVCVRGDSESSRTGGVLLYIDKNIKFDVNNVNRSEGNWWTIVIKIRNKNYNGILMLVYHSPNGNDADFMYYLEETCNRDMLSGSVIIMGDFNIDMKIKNYYQNKLVRTMYLAGLKQLVNEPTRITDHSETIIDLVFSNRKIKTIVQHEPKITDHSVVLLQWNVDIEWRKSRSIISRNYKGMDVETFMTKIDTRLSCIEGNDTNTLANAAVKVMVECLDEEAPAREVALRDKWQGKQWFTGEILEMVKQRDDAYRLARTRKEKNDWEMY